MDNKNFRRTLVTAALPYANGPIHLGHLAGAYLPADIFVRFKRLKEEDVLFICGSDEHGVPITLTAEKEGVPPKVIIDRYHEMNRNAFENFGISFDNYSRTSLPIHHKTAQEFFLKYYENKILKQKKEFQFYDEKLKMFLPDRYLVGTCPHCGSEDARGDQCESCGSYLNSTELINPKSKVTGETPVLKETVHWYFPLGDYQLRLEKYIEEKDRQEGWKENVLNYCRSWFNEGLQDRAITRDLDWGVRVPLKEYESKVLYVWFEAVLGYISSTKEWAEKRNQPDEWKKYWLDDKTKYIAFIGKDNVVFHCIVFPAMLMAWNDLSDEKYILPDNVPANEFLNYEGLKFSKSRGWGIDLQDFLNHFPPDPLRYYLASIIPENRDTDFYWRDFQAKNNNELADIFGNFVNRTLTFIEKHFNSYVPEVTSLNDIDKQLLEQIAQYKERIELLFEKIKIKDAVNEIMNLARLGNKYFNDSQPWKTIKENRDACATTINLSLQMIRTLAVMFSPIIPFTSEKIFKMINVDKPSWKLWKECEKPLIPPGHKIGKAEIVFSKIDDKVVEPFVKSQEKQEPEKSENSSNIITIDDFRKVELKVAKIIKCEKITNSKKLLRLQVDLGNEMRQIIAGLAEFYEPDELVGKKVLIVANLKEAKLMNELSQGMVLAVEDENKKLKIVSLEESLPIGSLLK